MSNQSQNIETTSENDKINKEYVEVDLSQIPKIERNHKWYQKGYWIFCDACENPHSSFIGRDSLLVGMENGKPVFKKRATGI